MTSKTQGKKAFKLPSGAYISKSDRDWVLSLKNAQIEQLTLLVKRFMMCRSEDGISWTVGASAHAGDSLNKVYLTAKHHFAAETGVNDGR